MTGADENARAAAIARLYDLDLSVDAGDVELFQALARRTGLGPHVLEHLVHAVGDEDELARVRVVVDAEVVVVLAVAVPMAGDGLQRHHRDEAVHVEQLVDLGEARGAIRLAASVDQRLEVAVVGHVGLAAGLVAVVAD